MLLIWAFLLSALPKGLSAASIFCPQPEASDQTIDDMIDCLGLRFTWIHSVFNNFPSLLNFVSRLRCATGICPRDLEGYGCSCRFVAAGTSVDPLDFCCETQRLCYQSAAPCRQEVPLPPYNYTCAAANITCDGGDLCQQRFCECDQAAIECMTESSYNSSLRGFAESSCSDFNQTGLFGGPEKLDESLQDSDVFKALNDSASFQSSNVSLLSAELDPLMTGWVDNSSDTEGLNGDLVTQAVNSPSLLIPAGRIYNWHSIRGFCG
ncbi:otoconin-90 [Gouania willdenowi]|uniref:otoconin-90 n=1 Tax=Gouania willdenowi TaxID=441366 RepID=UPI0010567CAC|nr:otoconin-90 [Gouania willdenowi]